MVARSIVIGLALVALVGCNQVFRLRETAQRPPVDAQQFDAPADAPYSCPIGTEPKFSEIFHQVVLHGGCMHYSTSTPAANVALGTCFETAGPSVQYAEQGPIDEQ